MKLNLGFNPFPELVTERLLLRSIDIRDNEQLLALRSNLEVNRFLDRDLMANLEEANEFILKIKKEIEDQNSIAWAITFQSDAKLIGMISLWRIVKEHFRAEIGYMILPEYWGQGIADEAIKSVIKYGFGEMNLHSLEANINPLNGASKKLVERNRFRQEAYFTENYYYNGVFTDSAIYSLVRTW